MRHSSLRNVAERVYGVAKKRFPLLSGMTSYPFPTQVSLVMTCMFLHNFVRKNQIHNDAFDHLDDDEMYGENDDGNVHEYDEYVDDPASHNDAVDWRNDIAQRMWDDYQEVLVARNI